MDQLIAALRSGQVPRTPTFSTLLSVEKLDGSNFATWSALVVSAIAPPPGAIEHLLETIAYGPECLSAAMSWSIVVFSCVMTDEASSSRSEVVLGKGQTPVRGTSSSNNIMPSFGVRNRSTPSPTLHLRKILESVIIAGRRVM